MSSLGKLAFSAFVSQELQLEYHRAITLPQSDKFLNIL